MNIYGECMKSVYGMFERYAEKHPGILDAPSCAGSLNRFKIPARNIVNRRYTEAEQADAVDLMRGGMGPSKVADLRGYNRSRCQFWATQAGITFRKYL